MHLSKATKYNQEFCGQTSPSLIGILQRWLQLDLFHQVTDLLFLLTFHFRAARCLPRSSTSPQPFLPRWLQSCIPTSCEPCIPSSTYAWWHLPCSPSRDPRATCLSPWPSHSAPVSWSSAYPTWWSFAPTSSWDARRNRNQSIDARGCSYGQESC